MDTQGSILLLIFMIIFNILDSLNYVDILYVQQCLPVFFFSIFFALPVWIFAISEVWNFYTVNSVSLFIYSSWPTWLRRSSVSQDYKNILVYFLLPVIQCFGVFFKSLYFFFRADKKVHSKTERKILRYFIYLLPPHIHSQHPFSEWYIFYQVWTYIDTPSP